MVDSPINSNSLRLLLSEVIWLEAEHFKQAQEISERLGNSTYLSEEHQLPRYDSATATWQTYLNVLGLLGLEEWLQDRIPDRPINRDINFRETMCYLKMGEFKYGVIATEHLLDEVITIPQAVLDRPELVAHFYVVVEVYEEQEQVIIRGFLRYDRLSNYLATVHLPHLEDGYYQLPLSLLEVEPHHLLFYSRYLDTTAISLPVASAENSAKTFKEELPKARTNLSQWLQGVLNEGWLSCEVFLNTEANLAWSIRNAPEKAQGGKLINLGIQLGSKKVMLLVTVTEEASAKRRVGVQLYPTDEEKYLPPHLRLILFSKAGKKLQEIQSRGQDNYIQLKPFQGKQGTCFSIEVCMHDVCLREDFEL